MKEKIFFPKSKEDSEHYKNIKKLVDQAIQIVPNRRRIFAQVKAISFPLVFLTLYLLAILSIQNINLPSFFMERIFSRYPLIVLPPATNIASFPCRELNNSLRSGNLNASDFLTFRFLSLRVNLQ